MSIVDTRDIPFQSPAAVPRDAAVEQTTIAEVPETERLAARQYHVDIPFTAPRPTFVSRLYDDRKAFYKELERKKHEVQASRSASESTLTFEPTVTPHPVHAFNRATHVVERLSNDAARRITEQRGSSEPRSSSARHSTDGPLPRVAREYDVAMREHDMHVAYLREMHEKEQMPTFKPQVASHPKPTRSTSNLEHVASSTTTVADAYRAATIAKKLRDREAAQINILEDDKHRKRREEIIRKAKERSTSRPAAPPSSPAADTSSAAVLTHKKLSREETAAIAQRLYADGAKASHAAVEAALAQQRLEEAEAAKQRRLKREAEYERARREHDAAVAKHAQQEQERLEREREKANRTMDMLESVILQGGASHPASHEGEEPSTARVLTFDRAASVSIASSVVDRAIEDARVAKRQEDAAKLVLKRRLESEAKRLAKQAEEEKMAQALNQRFAAAVEKTRHPPPGASAVPVKGWDDVIKRRELSERMKREAAAKLTVRPRAIHRTYDANGRLVTAFDPFTGLESHEQEMFDRRTARLEEVRAEIEPPFEPVAKAGSFHRQRPSQEEPSHSESPNKHSAEPH